MGPNKPKGNSVPRKPLQQLLISTLVSIPLVGGLFYIGFSESNWLLSLLGGISLFSWLMSVAQLWRLHRNNQILGEALTCPECETTDGLDFKIESQQHEGHNMTAKMREFCQHCAYESEEQSLIYPLEKELVEIMQEEDQAKSISKRRAEEAWYRKKVIKMVSET